MPRHRATRILLYFIDNSINSPESFKLPVGIEGKNETGILSKCLFFHFPARLSNMQIEKQVKFSFKNFRFQSCVKCYLFSASYSFIIQGDSKTLFN